MAIKRMVLGATRKSAPPAAVEQALKVKFADEVPKDDV